MIFNHSSSSSPPPQYPSPPSQLHQRASTTHNGKWTQIQHVKYIVFMEFHRDLFKSKESRRANKFYKQMSAFIKTRNPLQCRSHHQKLQDRYCYANKIILAFKQHGDMQLYDKIRSQLIESKSDKHPSVQRLNTISSNTQVQCQTEIKGIDTQFIFNYPSFNNLYDVHQYHPQQQQLSYHGGQSFLNTMIQLPNNPSIFYYSIPHPVNLM